MLKILAYVLAPFAVGYAALRIIDRPGPPPVDPAPPPAPTDPRAPELLTGALRTELGRTYFAAVETNGVVNAAASVPAVESAARGLGFSDVAVFTVPPVAWPLKKGAGDYFVRGTFTDPAREGRELEREKSVPFGSVRVLEVWGSR